jgi:hypothetical protein
MLAFHTVGWGRVLLMCACLCRLSCLLLPAVEDLVAQIARESPEAQQRRAQQSTFNEFNTGVGLAICAALAGWALFLEAPAGMCGGRLRHASSNHNIIDAASSILAILRSLILSLLLPLQAKEQLADEQAYREKMQEQKAEGDPQAQAEGMLKMKTAKIRKAR